MKSIDLFEALNDIPADILLSAEARYTAEPQRRIDRRSGFAQSGCAYHAHHAPSARVPKPDSGREYCRV